MSLAPKLAIWDKHRKQNSTGYLYSDAAIEHTNASVPMDFDMFLWREDYHFAALLLNLIQKFW